MTAIRNGFLVLLIFALPATANAGCGLFSPCGGPSWIGFSLALPVPRLPHLHTFHAYGPRSPMCGQGHWVGSGCGLGRCGLGRCGFGGCGLGHCGNPCGIANPCTPPLLTTPPATITPAPTFTPSPTLTLPSTTCNPCGPALTQTLVPQQQVTYRDVPQIQYRQQAYTENVPVTTYRQVTRFRSVPYQTVARIPQVSTRYIPQLTAAAPCNPCTAGISTPIYGYGATAALPYAPTPTEATQSAGVPEYPYPVPQPQAQGGGDWQTIPQRQAQDSSGIQQMGYYAPAMQQPVRQPSAQGMFRPAPSAATAWQSRFLR